MSSKQLSKRNLLYFTIAFAIIALFFGLWTQYNSTKSNDVDIDSGTILPVPHDISPFHLVSTDDKPFTNDNLKGQWSLLFFGFTKCPQLCPTTLSLLNDAYQNIEKHNNVPLPQVVFISVDPDRDTSKNIKEYLSGYNKNFVGATGSQNALDTLTREMSVLYAKVENPNAKNIEDYNIDHSGTVLMVNPLGQLFAVFSTPQDANEFSDDVEKIEAHYKYKA